MADFSYLTKIDRSAISIVDLDQSEKEDTRYWLSKSAVERFMALEFLRQQFHSNDSDSPGLQRFLEVVEPAWG